MTSTGIKDWCDVSGVELELWEIKAIRKIDAVWVALQNSKKDDE